MAIDYATAKPSAKEIVHEQLYCALTGVPVSAEEAYWAPPLVTFRQLITALPLPPDADKSLLRLTLLGAINWTRIWYRPGKRTPAQIAHHLVNKVLRKSLG